MKTYAEKLRDPRWQRKRLEIMQRDEFSCMECGDHLSPLNVHHHYYEKGKAPWEYPDDALITLCERCHEAVEWDRAEILKRISYEVSRTNILSILKHDPFGGLAYAGAISERIVPKYRIRYAKQVIAEMNQIIEEIEGREAI